MKLIFVKQHRVINIKEEIQDVFECVREYISFIKSTYIGYSLYFSFLVY
jgi:hypothetical protein